MNVKTKKIKVFMLVFALFFVFSFSNNKARAGYWGESLAAAKMEVMLTELYKKIWAIMTMAAKQAALEMINNSVNNMISQSGLGGPLFIQNWDEFLNVEPLQNTNIVMNDFFASMTSGRSDPYSYVPGANGTGCNTGAKCVEGASTSREGVVKGDFVSDLGNNYYMYIQQTAQNSIMQNIPQINAYEFCQDPMNPLSDANSNPLKCLSATSGQSFEISLATQEKYFAELAKQQRLAEIQAIAYQGFRAVESGGSVITPGTTISDILSQAQNLGNLIIAGANSPEEVISAAVIGITERAVKSGIGQAQQIVQREINNSVNNVSREIRKANDPRTYFNVNY